MKEMVKETRKCMDKVEAIMEAIIKFNKRQDKYNIFVTSYPAVRFTKKNEQNPYTLTSTYLALSTF
jgi:hypothetical protein